jgi:hypothetical protein
MSSNQKQQIQKTGDARHDTRWRFLDHNKTILKIITPPKQSSIHI